MTAEIAILNRSAVALAADSAVTIQVRGVEKTYDSVDKLFQLTDSGPVGIMIFGGAEFMEIPIETVIKTFRKSRFAAPKPYLQDYATAFFEFLETEVPVPDSVASRNVERILYDEIENLQRDAFNKVVSELSKSTGKKKPDFPKAYASNVLSEIKSRISEINSVDSCEAVGVADDITVAKKYSDVVSRIEKSLFRDSVLDDDGRELLSLLCGMILRRNVYSSQLSGIVFAGFGDNEWFPKLAVYETDGLVCEKVKRRRVSYVDIDRSGSGAHIEPLAQKEMVERFLDGVDPDYDEYVRNVFSALFEGLAIDLVSEFSDPQMPPEKKVVEDRITALIGDAMVRFSALADGRKKENFRQHIEDMVHFLSKSDLAKMAESLVSITSMKRKFSSEQESVAGPIDVAVISKGDGFVWIKRKHYFDKELNARYFRKIDGERGAS